MVKQNVWQRLQVMKHFSLFNPRILSTRLVFPSSIAISAGQSKKKKNEFLQKSIFLLCFFGSCNSENLSAAATDSTMWRMKSLLLPLFQTCCRMLCFCPPSSKYEFLSIARTYLWASAHFDIILWSFVRETTKATMLKKSCSFRRKNMLSSSR